MDWPILVSLSLSIGIFACVIWLIRERRLREKYALLWLITSVFIVLLAASRRILEFTALSIGIYYPPALLFLVGILFLLLVNIGHSVSLSRLSESNRLLAQEIALLRRQLEEERAARGAGKES